MKPVSAIVRGHQANRLLIKLPYLAVLLTGAWNAMFYWPICAAILSKSNVGYLGSVLSLASIFSPLILFSLNVFITRELADQSVRQAAIQLSVTVRWYLTAAFILSVVGHAVFGASVVFIAMVAQAYLIWALAVFRGLFQTARYFFLALLCFGVMPTIAVLASSKLHLSVVQVVQLQSVLIFFLSLMLLGRFSKPDLVMSIGYLKRGLKSTAMSTVSLIGVVVLFQAGRPLIAYLSGKEAAAEFQFSSAIGVGLLTAVIVLGDAVLPGYYALDEEPWLAKMNGFNRTLSRWIVPVTTVLSLLSYGLTKLICPPSYPADHIAWVASVIVLGVCPLALGSLSYSSAVYLRRGNMLAVPTVISTLIGGTLCFVLKQEVSIRVAFAIVVALCTKSLMQSYACEKRNARLNLLKPQIVPTAICFLVCLLALLYLG